MLRSNDVELAAQAAGSAVTGSAAHGNNILACLSDVELNLQGAVDRPRRLVALAGDVELGAFRQDFADVEAFELKTAGGGRCALHAAFGNSVRANDGHILREDGRELIRLGGRRQSAKE